MHQLKDEIEGRLFFEDGEWILDAEPYILVLFQRLFLGSYEQTFYDYETHQSNKYKFTHRPRFLQDSLSARKDIEWFLKRFKLEINEKDFNLLQHGSKEYDKIQEEGKHAFINYKDVKFDFVLPLRDYQLQACSLALKKRFLLIADQVGLGKTPIGIAIGSKNLPTLCVVPPHLATQWEYEIHKFIPNAKVIKIKGKKNYELPKADFYIISYHLLQYWIEALTKKHHIQSIIFDEIHYLRHSNTERYSAASLIADKCETKIGLSATPIMNYGNELYNIFDVLQKGILGEKYTFIREWCVGEQKIRDPELLGNFLRKNMFMLRRTREEVGMKIDAVNRSVYTVDANLDELQKIENDMKILAMKAITGTFKESSPSAIEFDMKLRQATGIAKAKAVAEIVKTIVESGEKVVLFGWHRDVYDIWLKELFSYNPVMYTGTETPKEKEESIKEFIEGNSKVFIMSLRSGAGINGLQLTSSYAVFGELDWSPAIMEQCIGRLWRDGQEHQVNAIFITIDDGADPFMKEVIGEKIDQQSKIMSAEASVISDTVKDEHLKSMAREFLKSKGMNIEKIEAEKKVELKGELFINEDLQDKETKEIFDLIRKNAKYFKDEKELQDYIENLLYKNNISYKREFKISKKSFVDFNVQNILIECKVKGFSKREMLKQIRRYKYEHPETKSIIIITPKPFRHFRIDDVPVYAIDFSNASLLMNNLA